MILIMPNNLEQVKENIDLYDGVILSIEKFSVNTIYTITIADLKSIIPLLKDKEIFISLNKNIENNEIDELEKILFDLNNYPIKGVLYSDPAIVTYKSKLNYDLVWSQEHLTTNYETINYWHQFGVNYTYLSSDITKNETIDIINNANTKLMTNLFGYLPIFVSKRHIVMNYLKHFHIKDNSKIYYIEKENKTYPIIDSNYTCVFSNNIFNGLKEFFNIKTDYYICNGLLIENEKFRKVLKIISNISLENIEVCYSKVNDLFDNIDTIFLYQETVSKVKKCK